MASALTSPERRGKRERVIFFFFWSKGRVKVVNGGFGRCVRLFENKRAEEEERLLDSIMFCPTGSFVSAASCRTHFITSKRAQRRLYKREGGCGGLGAWLHCQQEEGADPHLTLDLAAGSLQRPSKTPTPCSSGGVEGVRSAVFCPR